MSFDETLARRVRRLLPNGAEERRMFGGMGFMVDGQLCCSVSGEGLLIRVTAGSREELRSHPAVHPMVMGKRTMSGYVRVRLDALVDDRELSRWVQKGMDAAAALPAKANRASEAGSERNLLR